ncbi:MAG: type I-E CRISPR-associated protein Cas7/Cse4/CasC [Proteobacteria bacterium]|nr:type I-E CRISPR-associated protein Cas7/Cse4/CasC [Pseudomonadota bacterium]
MAKFIQLHLLTSYPPANLNRDDLGRPKTAIMGGVQRLRVSSQSLKRAWRTSGFFKTGPLSSHAGVRTKEMGTRIQQRLIEGGVSEDDAAAWAGRIAGVFGKLKKNSIEIEQLAHFSPEEQKAVQDLADRLIQAGRAPAEDELKLLEKNHTAVDIALFGRMLAANPFFNTEAAAQVAHAVSVHEAAVEDDFFTAVDDLNEGVEDVGAAHMGELEFGAGLFYLYVCIDGDLLKKNLEQKPELAPMAVRALTEAAAKTAPTGKQNSFASRAYASYIMAEKGDQQPRSLVVSFLKPVGGTDYLAESIEHLEATCGRMDAAYGPCADERKVMNVFSGQGALEGILNFVEGF